MEKLRVGVIFGGLSAENEVSLATGRYICSLLDPQPFVGTPFYLDKTGQLWQVPDKLVIQNTTADVELRLGREAQKIHFENLPEKVDLIFNALLGKYGEDGCIQGVLELLRIPYTGSGILASALGMDKKIHKKMLAAAGFHVAKGFDIRHSTFEIRDAVERINSEIGFPCVVKPTREGSSMGVSVVKNVAGLDVAFEYAFKYDREVLVEEYLYGVEYTCVVWGNDDPQAMLPTEVIFEGDFFTYEGKYMPGKTQTITPARLCEEVIAEIQRQSVAIYKLIGCKGYGRVDGFVVPKSKILNESAPQPARLQYPTPEVGSDNGGFPRPNCANLTLEQVEIYVTEPHTGTIMVPSSFVFQQASQFKITLEDKFRGKKVSAPLTPRMFVTKIIEMAIVAHQNKKSLL